MSRRARGEGSVAKDGAGYVALLHIDGKRVKRRARTKTEAVALLAELRRIRDENEDLPPARESRYTVGQLLDDWLAHGEAIRDWTPATAEGYRSIVEAHLRPALGRLDARRLPRARVQRLIADLSVDRTPGTVRNIHAVLRSAIAFGRVSPNATDVELPSVRREQVQPLSLAQTQRLMRALEGERYRVLYIVTLVLGLRQSEVREIRWDDIDLDLRLLHVRRRSYRRGGAEHTGRTKSERSRRTIRFPEEIALLLRYHLERQREIREALGSWEQPGLVFTNRRGGYVYGPYLRTRLRLVLRRASLDEDLRFHDLRHTAASMLLAMGATLKDVQETLGHSDYQLTANTYTHLLDESRNAIADRMGAFLRGEFISSQISSQEAAGGAGGLSDERTPDSN